MSELKSSLDWRNIHTITVRPNYFLGIVKHGKWSSSIAALRSWQHKESRRSNILKLLQCVMLQASQGYILTAFQYFLNTIIPEDIGLSDPSIIVPVSTCVKRWEKYFLPKSKSDKEKVWPIPMNILQEAISDLFKTCEIIANVQKNRFTPSLITIAIMHHVNNSWSSQSGWTHRVKQFQNTLDNFFKSETTESIAFLLEHHVRPICIALEDCLLYINWSKAQNKVNKSVTPIKTSLMYKDIWFTLHGRKPLSTLKDSIITTIADLNKSHSRLWYYMMLLVIIFPEVKNSKTLLVSDYIDPDETFARLFPENQPLPVIPDYAMDKHVGRPGGYKRFQTEGIYVPQAKIWQPELNQQLSDEAFQLRFNYEEKHGKNSSKTQKVVDKLIAKQLKTIEKRKREFSEEKDETKQPVTKKAKTVSKLPKMQPIFNVPVGQPVTGRAKKYVYLYPDVVKKGPYLNKRDKWQVDYIMKSTQLIHHINLKQGIDSTVIFPTVEKQDDGSWFIFWKNIGKYDNIQIERRTTKLADDVTVASRKSFIYRASDVDVQLLSKELLEECLNHLYARFIVGVGDSGLWNILIDNHHISNEKVCGKAVGIDLEEKRKFKTLPASKIQCLFSKIYHADFWTPWMKSVKQVSVEWAKQNLDPVMIERVNHFANLIE